MRLAETSPPSFALADLPSADTDAVIHIAAKNSMSPDTANVVDAAVQDTLALMQQAAKYPNIASYVLTSSRTAAFQPKGTSEVEMYDQSSWNESVVEAAYSRCERDARKGALSCESRQHAHCTSPIGPPGGIGMANIVSPFHARTQTWRAKCGVSRLPGSTTAMPK